MCNFEKVNRYFIIVFSDIEIARSQEPKNIMELAKEIGLEESEVVLYGNKKAKISISTLDRLKNINNGNYVVVTGCVHIEFFSQKLYNLIQIVSIIPVRDTRQLMLRNSIL